MTRRPIHRALPPISLLLLSSTALGQQTVIDHCKQTSSDADRIACLEAALLGKSVQEEVTSSAMPKKEAAAEAVTTVAADPVKATQVDPPSMTLDAGPANDTVDDAAVPAATVISADSNDIGAEQVAARTQSRGEREESLEAARGLVIKKYEWVPYERMVIHLENGQVWRQIKGDKNRIRTSLDRNQTADITESRLSGYTLRLNEIRRTIRVERIR